MSMFHELMMRKKEEIMYATIKGTLTENDGVFSGFSASGYLELQQNLDSDNLEMVIDFTTGNSLTAYETIFLNRSIFDLEYYNGYLASYNWQSSSYVQVIPSTDFTTNTHYKVKIKRNGNTISFSYSKNGSAFIDTGSFTTTKTATNLPCFGNSSVNTSRYFAGSIDLNNSYIKIGSTKYNLQAVVGYTVVGSPTITDGVVSGFTTTSYLRLPQPTLGLADFEIATCFKANSIQSARLVSDVVSGSTVMGISIVNNSGIRAVFNGSIHTFVQSSVVYNTTDNYYVIMYRKGTTIGIKVSTDNINWTEKTDTIQSTDELNFATPIELGVNRYGGGAFDGSLDLNNTDIKINNKLWFNGQQA